jgi:hypothetical protein
MWSSDTGRRAPGQAAHYNGLCGRPQRVRTGQQLLDNGTAETAVALVKHRVLTFRNCTLPYFEQYLDAVIVQPTYEA